MRHFIPAIVFSALFIAACSNPPSAVTPTVQSVQIDQPIQVRELEQEWEYLVVTGGGVYFNLVGEDRKQEEIGFSREANATQDALDILGAQGWELVGIIGAIGGDQEFILKRPKRKTA